MLTFGENAKQFSIEAALFTFLLAMYAGSNLPILLTLFIVSVFITAILVVMK